VGGGNIRLAWDVLKKPTFPANLYLSALPPPHARALRMCPQHRYGLKASKATYGGPQAFNNLIMPIIAPAMFAQKRDLDWHTAIAHYGHNYPSKLFEHQC